MNKENELPNLLYKYMKKEYAEAFIQDGELQIGTLFNFRKIEKAGIGDKDEGTKEIYINDPLVDSRNPRYPPELLEKFGVIVEGGGVFHAEQSKFVRHEYSQDYYIFCTSEEHSEKLMREFDYDACIRINNLELFFRAITKCLLNKGLVRQEWYIVKCQYVDRSQYYLQADKLPPEIIKAPRFKQQKEWRVMWIPIETEIKPEIIRCRAAREYCTLI